MESLIDLEPEEEEEEDDMIYECPGLAPPGEMVVTNPFFLSDGFQVHTVLVSVQLVTLRQA